MRTVSIVVLLLACFAPGCRTYVRLYNPPTLKVPAMEPNLDTVRKYVIKGASNAGWEVLDENENTIIVGNKPYRHARYAICSITYTLHNVKIEYSSSFNLRYTFATEGRQLARKDYNMTVNALTQAVKFQLKEMKRIREDF
jgi:hypothetical protein